MNRVFKDTKTRAILNIASPQSLAPSSVLERVVPQQYVQKSKQAYGRYCHPCRAVCGISKDATMTHKFHAHKGNYHREYKIHACNQDMKLNNIDDPLGHVFLHFQLCGQKGSTANHENYASYTSKPVINKRSI